MPGLKAALASGRPVRVFSLGQLCHPKLVEMVAQVGGFDAIWLDQEHVGLSIPQIEDATRAARAAGIDTFVRLLAKDHAATMRPLEAGSSGLMAAMVRSVREVEDLVRWGRFHPRGQRGINGAGVDGRYGSMGLKDYFAQAEETTVLGVQIEHVDALEVVEKIAAVPGVDFLFVGPADLSQSLGIPGEWEHPRLWEAIERTARACAAASIPWGFLPLSPEHARRSLDLGCRMLSIGVDVWAWRRGVQSFKEQYSAYFTS